MLVLNGTVGHDRCEGGMEKVGAHITFGKEGWPVGTTERSVDGNPDDAPPLFLVEGSPPIVGFLDGLRPVRKPYQKNWLLGSLTISHLPSTIQSSLYRQEATALEPWAL